MPLLCSKLLAIIVNMESQLEKLENELCCIKRVADPGGRGMPWSLPRPCENSGGSRISPRRRHQLPGGRQHTILPNFPKNCMKLKEF